MLGAALDELAVATAEFGGVFAGGEGAAEEQGGDDGEVLEKMAQSGELEYWDMAGRIMAHAYNDELSKTAAPDYIDLDDIDGETMMELIESGEYELIDLEKTAAQMPDGSYKSVSQMSRAERAAYSAHRKARKEGGSRKGFGLKGMTPAERRSAVAKYRAGEGFRKVKGQPRRAWAALQRLSKNPRARMAAAALGAAGAGAGAAYGLQRR